MNLSKWTPPDEGALFVVTGPSGTGKTTLVKAALRVIPSLAFSTSSTTRAPRSGEQHGVDYFFCSQENFERDIQAERFLEWAEVYGRYYGTPKAPIEQAIGEGKSIILDIDAQGAEQIRNKMPAAISIFVLPPNIATLQQRLEQRKTDSKAIIAGRMREAREQLRQCVHFDYIIVNDDLESAKNQFQAIVIAELLRKNRRKSTINHFASHN